MVRAFHVLGVFCLCLLFFACGSTAGTGDSGSDDQGAVDITDPSDPGTEDTQAGDADSGTASDPGAGDAELPVDTGTGCICPPTKHCTEDGECEDDICLKGGATCESLSERKVCNEDGSAFELFLCPEATICFLGECIEPICDPEGPAVCENGQRKECNSLGVDYNYFDCPGGTSCVDGTCVPIQPNVIFIVDSSASMNWMNPEGSYPDDCTGETCPPWNWPDCDDPENPSTRLGKVKKALQNVLISPEAGNLRLALQRFPQLFYIPSLLGSSGPTCAGSPLWGLDKFSPDNTVVHLEHAIDANAMAGSSLSQIMPVPFNVDEESTHDEIMRWVDFDHTYTPTGETCGILTQCTDYNTEMACHEGECVTMAEPELRAMGNTPLGRSLFYAGEYFRHMVVLEGQACTEEADCGSPHYDCVDGVCTDPFRACRPNVIILLTDGVESLDVWPDKFFYPLVQAKRLHYGLGCSSDADCMNGATCDQGVCSASELNDPEKVCHLTDVPCTSHSQCTDFPYPCGGTASTCSGKCEETGAGFTDDVGANVLRDATGEPISVTVNVVDVSSIVNSNSILAKHGGGQYLHVDVNDVSSIIEAITPLLDIKADPEICAP
ncbi:MAG: hypothetical protein CMH54_15215 [Myxococcales bacterium]|nr:hypothetical protein [Myxococcales bacterium]